MDDDRLIHGLKMGDEDAYRRLYSKYYISMCYHAQKIVHSKEGAEEIVQHTFIKIWETRKRLDIHKSLYSYLYRAVINNCINYLKSISVPSNQRLILMQDVQDYMKISQDNGYSIYIATELWSKIENAINELPEKCKQIFEQSRFEGKTHDEIAGFFGVTKNTVQKQISIALKKIKDALHDHLTVFFVSFFKYN